MVQEKGGRLLRLLSAMVMLISVTKRCWKSVGVIGKSGKLEFGLWRPEEQGDNL